ncbi:MAG TPA: hypothetical protein VFY45_25195, partial [Baekduia sp.]|nr:hypothetical protein [Baekduia sp.]
MAKRYPHIVALPGDPAPAPGWRYWLIAVLGAPLLTVGIALLVLWAGPDIQMNTDEVLSLGVLAAAALGALLSQTLSRVRSLPRRTRVGWTLAGALTAGVSVLPVGFVLLMSMFIIGCS